jgi:hypothetical protein
MYRLLALGLLAATPAMAQDTVVDADAAPKKIRSVFVYGNEPCPQAANADEIVVCRRAPAEEQYRIPPPLREAPANPANTAWSERVDAVIEANDSNVPGSCSPVGSQGQTGCSRKAAERWAADRRAQGEEPVVPLP